MEKKEISVNGKLIEINELKYKQVAELGDVPKTEVAKKLMLLSTNLSEEEYENLNLVTGLKIQKEINQLNNLEDFQNALS